MNDADKLIAATFAAAMIARQTAPGPSDFFVFYDACVTEILARESAESAVRREQKLVAENKAWG